MQGTDRKRVKTKDADDGARELHYFFGT